VILLDEIEKAHPDVFNILLQVLEEGQLSDNLGHAVSFRNAVLIMTSNLGAREINKDSSLGFQSEEGSGMNFKDIRNFVMNEVKRAFNPEFINRIDEIVVFHNLDRTHLASIFDLMVKEISDRLVEQKISITVRKPARQYLIEKGFDEKFGARPLRRLLQKEFEDPLSLEILRGRFSAGDTIDIDLKDGKVSFRRRGGRRRASTVPVTAAAPAAPAAPASGPAVRHPAPPAEEEAEPAEAEKVPT
jgi:ATP-dependent Clp protease ATP-binding subunit ClpC